MNMTIRRTGLFHKQDENGLTAKVSVVLIGSTVMEEFLVKGANIHPPKLILIKSSILFYVTNEFIRSSCATNATTNELELYV